MNRIDLGRTHGRSRACRGSLLDKEGEDYIDNTLLRPKSYIAVAYIGHTMAGNGRRGERRDVILLSIDRRFAQQIFKEEKKYEFRKPNLPEDVKYIILLENGSRNIIGGFSVGEIHQRDIDTLWDEFGKEISEEDRFYDYYLGWDEGIAIEVGKVEQFDNPISAEDIENIDPYFNIPNQINHLYPTNKVLRRLSDQSPMIKSFLPDSEESTLERWMDHDESTATSPSEDTQENVKCSFRKKVKADEEKFRELFEGSGVPSEYEDIDEDFLNHIIESHHRGEDPYGYFTRKKEVMALLRGEDIAGFTTLTWKRGGSVKYGPTILDEDYRGRGLGPKFRKILDEYLKHKGVRKAYSTIPETHDRAIRYLIKSGYQVEAHMIRQYHRAHDELVFGKLLNSEIPTIPPLREREPVEELKYSVSSADFNDFTQYIIDAAKPWYNDIDSDFVKSVKEAEKRGLDSRFSKKGKRVFIGHNDERILCTAISSFKRGNSVKISPLFSDITGDRLHQFLNFVEEDIKEGVEVNKFYTHVPVPDQGLTTFFREHGYQPEGLLREPYKEGIDMIFFGKMEN